MSSILSTKKLSQKQRNLILDAKIDLTEYNAISIKLLPFSVEKKTQNAIITSQNTVKAIVEKKISIENCFCVGEKTKLSLESEGYNVKEMFPYGKTLAQHLIKNYSNETFVFFCGNIRNDDLPNLLKENNLYFEEKTVYTTELKPKKFTASFDGILFYSPSGVESFHLQNKINNSTAFCIGTTTAKAAKKYTNNIIIANTPTVESLIDKMIENINKT